MYVAQFFQILASLFLIFMGRKLFWVFVGISGFLGGAAIASMSLQGQSDLLRFGLALLAGIAGVLLAVFLQRLAVSFSGFLLSGYTALSAMQHAHWHVLPEWAVFFIAGIVGAILAAVLFDWALILLSCTTGAFLFIQVTRLQFGWEAIIFFLLSVFGFVVQSRQLRDRTIRAVR